MQNPPRGFAGGEAKDEEEEMEEEEEGKEEEDGVQMTFPKCLQDIFDAPRDISEMSTGHLVQRSSGTKMFLKCFSDFRRNLKMFLKCF